MAISSFHSFIIGANRPVGHFLTRSLASQDLMYKGVGFESHERLALAATAQPFFILVPSLFHPDDYEHIPFWLEQAEEQDVPVFLLSSMAVFRGRPDTAYQETDNQYADHPLALNLLALEALARNNRRHLILRIGQGFSLMADDFANYLLTAIRDEHTLSLDMQRKFSPTPADDIADVILAMLRQAACSDSLWGTYHFCGVEPISSYAFAEALLAEASQYEDLRGVELKSQEGGLMPTVWAPVADNTQLFHTFGIKGKAWRKGLSRLIRRYYRAEERGRTEERGPEAGGC